MKKKAPSISHDEEQIKEFRKHPHRAMGYLNACVEVAFRENEPELILSALAVVSRSYGVTRLAKKTRLQRESLHRMLSQKGNPEWNSLFQLFRALHIRPKMEYVQSKAA